MKKGIKVLIVFALAMALAASGFWLVHRFIESKEQQTSFQELAESVLLEKHIMSESSMPSLDVATPAQDDPMAPSLSAPTPHPAPEVLHDLAALKEKNTDCIGWIRVPGTEIDYPLMWTPNDPEHYLHLDFYGDYSDYGVPFLDARCDLSSDNLILYGHNMFDGTMFSGLHKFCDDEYAEEHRQIILETPDGAREYRVIAVCQTNSLESKVYRHINFTDPAEMTEFLDAAKEDSVFFDVENDESERFITLSTCDSWGQNRRIAVIGEEIA